MAACAHRAQAFAAVLWSRGSTVWALLLAVILGLSLLASGLRIGGGGVAIEGAALRDCVGGDQAHNYDAPGQPPPRLLDAELRKDSQDDGDDRESQAELVADVVTPCSVGSPVVLTERCSAAAQRAREGHGARGPPSA